MTHSIRLIHGDAIAEMRELDALSVDCIITDPPYFAPAVHYRSRVTWGRTWADMSLLGHFFFTLADECKRVLKPLGHVFIFCHHESYPVLYPALYGLWSFMSCLIWDKVEPGLGKVFRKRYEMILWASEKGAPVNTRGKLYTDILTYKSIRTRNRKHPVHKPPELMEELLEVTTNRGDLVLDPFMGSGSIGVACKKLGRDFIGIDLDKDYVVRAQGYIEDAKFQSDLFNETT